jgi:hypothetical protein
MSRGAVWLVISVGAMGCGPTVAPKTDAVAPGAAAESATAKALLEKHLARFQIEAPDTEPPIAKQEKVSRAKRPVLAPSAADRYDREANLLRPHLAAAPAKHGLARPATLALPTTADGAAQLEDGTGISMTMTLEGAKPVPAELSGGYIVHPAAHQSGADLLRRATGHGAEDFLVFEQAPAATNVSYKVALGETVAGLRLVGDTLELLDPIGAPRLRVSPPYLVGTDGTRTRAHLTVEGCAVDTNPAAPWKRALTKPGSRSCTVRISWGTVTYPAMLDPSWTTTAGTMVIPRQEHSATLLSTNHVLLAGGTAGGPSAENSAELYDPTTQTFAATGSLIAGRYHHAAVKLNDGRVFVTGGSTNFTPNLLSSTEVYTPGTGLWTAGPPMSSQRYYHTATMLADHRIVVLGGVASGGGTTVAVGDIYDATISGAAPTATAPMGHPRAGHTATLLPTGSVLVVGGDNSAFAYQPAELWNPTSGTWSATANQPASTRIFHSATPYTDGTGAKVLIAGGGTNNTNPTGGAAATSADSFNPTTSQFTPVAPLPEAHSYNQGVLLAHDNQVLITGSVGTAATPGNTVTRFFDPASGTWKAGDSLTDSRGGFHTATLLSDGTVLVAGGNNPTGALDSAELFNGCGPCAASDACHTGSCNGLTGCVQVDTSGCMTPFCLLPGSTCSTWLDDDHDGLSNVQETARGGSAVPFIDVNCNGVNDGVDIQLPGANPAAPDIYVQYDYMAAGGHTHQPPPAVLTQVTSAFNAHGIHVHFIAPSGSIAEHLVTTRDPAPTSACAGSDFVTMRTLRSVAFAPLASVIGATFQHPAYHYLVFAHNATLPDTALNGNACPIDPECGAHPDPTSSGSSDVQGDDVIVSLGYDIDLGIPIGIETFAGTTMHELGHNLGLKHGSLAAPAPETCYLNKPNYVSVMDYSYQDGIFVSTAVGGITNMTCSFDTDCATGPCATAGACHCTDDLGSSGGNICYRIDYSNNTLLTLTESSLDESQGVGGPATDQDIIVYCTTGLGCALNGPSHGAINWNNSDGSTETGVAADIAAIGAATFTLDTTTDWNNLTYTFQCTPNWGAGAPAGTGSRELSRKLARSEHLAYPPFAVGIDVRPECKDNWIVPKAKGEVPVAVYGSKKFAVANVEKDSLQLDNVKASKVTVSDLNHDRIPDLLAEFPMAALPVTNTTKDVTLTGWLTNSRALHGTDAVLPVASAGPRVTLLKGPTGFAKSLFPPNKQYESFTLKSCVKQVVDNCGKVLDPDVVGEIIKIQSDEPENKKDIDMEITGKHAFKLRRERDGGGDGRVYTVHFEVVDPTGDRTRSECKFEVPHNPGSTAVDSGPHSCVGKCP